MTHGEQQPVSVSLFNPRLAFLASLTASLGRHLMRTVGTFIRPITWFHQLWFESSTTVSFICWLRDSIPQQQQQQQQQQNGFQTLSLPPANSIGGQQAYVAPPGAAAMAAAMNAQHANPPVGSVPVAVACPPAAEVSGQGTWTGNSTLTYTQTMQPPDPRTHHPSYCTLSIVLLCWFSIQF